MLLLGSEAASEAPTVCGPEPEVLSNASMLRSWTVAPEVTQPGWGPEQAFAPGWRLALSKTARPALALIGGAKCGSTDAFEYLVARFGFGRGHGGGKELWCLAQPDHKSLHLCYRDAFSQVPPETLTIDGTPTYLHLIDRVMQQSAYAAINMQYALPDTAVLVLLRDPAKRSRSEYTWNYNANSALFRSYLGADINVQLDVELAYLQGASGRGLLELLLRPPGEVEAARVFHAYRQLSDGYSVWLARDPARCARVSELDVTDFTVGDTTVRTCLAWPILIPSLYYPLLLHWRSCAFRPGRAAVVQSEAYYANRGILDQLFSLPSRPLPYRPGSPANTQQYKGSNHGLSAESARRLRDFFELPNRRLRQLLRRLPAEGVPVLPPADEPGAWWPT